MTKEELKNLQGVSKVQELGHILSKSFDRMFNKSEDATNELIIKFNSLSFQESSAPNNNQQNYKTQKKQQVKKNGFLKQNGKLKIKIEVINKKQNLRQPSQTPSKLSTGAPQKDSDGISFRTRTKSQNTQLKSLKKTNQLTNLKEEQEKKNIRLKQLTKRRLQLMDRLKKIDAELIQVKKESSPPPAQKIKDDKSSLYQSNINRSSFIHNFNLSRLKKHTSQNIVEHHIKAVEMLEKINNQKIKRQQRIAAQFRKKQQQQIHKLQQIQKKRSLQLQQKKKRVQLILSKTDKSNKSKLVNQTKLNQFVANQSQLIPTTIIQKQNIQVINSKDTNFFDEEKKQTRMFTERDLEDDNQNISIKQQIVSKQIKSKQSLPDNIMNSTSKHQIILSGKLQ